jgi:diguanylate cyclase (GGDEF)-like protein
MRRGGLQNLPGWVVNAAATRGHLVLAIAATAAGLGFVGGRSSGRRGGELERRVLREQAMRDPLTGLANRRQLATSAASAFAPGGHGSATTRVGLVLLDLDGFKQVNDTHGHDVGDELLVCVGRRLAAVAIGGELAARLGGDEFCLLLSALPADADSADRWVRARAETIANALAGWYELSGRRVRIGASAGLADAPASSPAGLSGLLRAADQAMYEVKRSRPKSPSSHARIRELTG